MKLYCGAVKLYINDKYVIDEIDMTDVLIKDRGTHSNWRDLTLIPWAGAGKFTNQIHNSQLINVK